MSETSARYSSKIIKASALIPDTHVMLLEWDDEKTIRDNLASFRERNIFGKASRSRVDDILAVFRQRYLTEKLVVEALHILAGKQIQPEALHKILYFHAARADNTLHATVIEHIFRQYQVGKMNVSVQDLANTIRTWVSEGKTTKPWSEETITRVSHGVVATLRDFGILQGAANKSIAAPHLPLAAFAYIAFYLKQIPRSGQQVLHHDDWKLFLLEPNSVERLFIQADQHGLMTYHAAGSVIRIDFPAQTLKDYANVIVQRAS